VSTSPKESAPQLPVESPRFQASLLQLGIRIEELHKKAPEDFAKGGLSEDLAREKYETFEKKRLALIRQVMKHRERIKPQDVSKSFKILESPSISTAPELLDAALANTALMPHRGPRWSQESDSPRHVAKRMAAQGTAAGDRQAMVYLSSRRTASQVSPVDLITPEQQIAMQEQERLKQVALQQKKDIQKFLDDQMAAQQGEEMARQKALQNLQRVESLHQLRAQRVQEKQNAADARREKRMEEWKEFEARRRKEAAEQKAKLNKKREQGRKLREARVNQFEELHRLREENAERLREKNREYQRQKEEFAMSQLGIQAQKDQMLAQRQADTFTSLQARAESRQQSMAEKRQRVNEHLENLQKEREEAARQRHEHAMRAKEAYETGLKQRSETTHGNRQRRWDKRNENAKRLREELNSKAKEMREHIKQLDANEKDLKSRIMQNVDVNRSVRSMREELVQQNRERLERQKEYKRQVMLTEMLDRKKKAEDAAAAREMLRKAREIAQQQTQVVKSTVMEKLGRLKGETSPQKVQAVLRSLDSEMGLGLALTVGEEEGEGAMMGATGKMD